MTRRGGEGEEDAFPPTPTEFSSGRQATLLPPLEESGVDEEGGGAKIPFCKSGEITTCRRL